MICTHVVFDPVLARDLPDWVKYGTAMRGLEHGIGVICHPGAGEDLRERGLGGLKVWLGGMEKMLAAHGGEEKSVEGMEEVYLGGWMAVRALFTGELWCGIAVFGIIFFCSCSIPLVLFFA